MVSVFLKLLMDGCDDSRKLRSLAELLQGGEKCRQACAWGYFFFSQGHACPPGIAQQLSQRDGLALTSCFNLMLLLSWACLRGVRAGAASCVLLMWRPGSCLLLCSQLFPGVVLQNYQLLVAAKGTYWIFPTSNLIHFAAGGSSLQLMTFVVGEQEMCWESLPAPTSTPAASTWPGAALALKRHVDPSLAGGWSPCEEETERSVC